MTVAASVDTPRHWDLSRPYLIVQTQADWDLCDMKDVASDPDSGGVALSRISERVSDAAVAESACAVAVDRRCHLYLGDTESGTIQRVARPNDAGAVDRLGLFVGREAKPNPVGFSFQSNQSTGGIDPVAMVADTNDRLFIIDGADRTIVVLDLWSRRITERIRIGSADRPDQVPIDIAATDKAVWVLLDKPAQLLRISGRGLVQSVAADFAGQPIRLAASPGGLRAVLTRDGNDRTSIQFFDGYPPVRVPGATDLEFETDDRLLVGRGAGADLIELEIVGDRFTLSGVRRGHRFAGCGLVRMESGKVAYWDGDRLRRAAPAPDRFRTEGQVTTFRLEADEFQNTWGTLFLDSCIPHDTTVRVTAYTSDEPDADAAAAAALKTLSVDSRPVLRRQEGREQPWDRLAADDSFETYETPVLAQPGRYLWIRLELTGNSRRSPQIRELRVEKGRHGLLDKLPAVFSAEPDRADFLGRYLAMAEGTVYDLDVRSTLRHILFDPHATPTEAIDWLSSVLGLVQDHRWSEQARRTLLSEIVGLFRRRGTIGSLSRMLEVYLQRRVGILEHFRMRGVAGQLLGASDDPPSSSVLGAGFRVGGLVGVNTDLDVEISLVDQYAHRFTVLIPVALDPDQREIVDHLLEVHRPAHTLVEVCTIEAGLRVGRGLHLEISSMIGYTGGFSTYVVGDGVLGQGAILGKPEVGSHVGSNRVGRVKAG